MSSIEHDSKGKCCEMIDLTSNGDESTRATSERPSDSEQRMHEHQNVSSTVLMGQPRQEHFRANQAIRQLGPYEEHQSHRRPTLPEPKRMRLSNGSYVFTGVPFQHGPASPAMFSPQVMWTNGQQGFIPQHMPQRASSVGHNMHIPPPHPTAPLSAAFPFQHNMPVPHAHNHIPRSPQANFTEPDWRAKLLTHARITQPLKRVEPGTDHTQVHGFLIAVEGDNNKSVSQALACISQHLKQEPNYFVSTANSPHCPSSGRKVTVADYLNIIADWHKYSEEIELFLTSAPPPLPRRIEPKPEKPSLPHLKDVMERGLSPSRDDNNNLPTPRSTNSPTIDLKSIGSLPFRQMSAGPSAPRVPLLLMQHYQYRATNAWSQYGVVEDRYTSFDNWHWYASMWRGIIAPDLIVFIKDYSAEEYARQQIKPVEMMQDLPCAIVKRVRGDEPLDEFVLRRLAFEVEEFLRLIPKRFKEMQDLKRRRASGV